MSSRLEIGREIPLSVNEWVEVNLEFIARKLEEQRQKQLKRHDIPPSALNPNERWPSEMPLCGVWENLRKSVGLPDGFKVGVTEVFVSSAPLSLEEKQHFCAFGRQDEILCITPGQFVKADGLTLGPGERIGVLVDKAPELIQVYGGGIAILYGKQNIIGTRLGIWY